MVLQHLEMHLINVACDDPGALIGAQLALPMLQDALDARSLEYAAERAKAAEDEVLRMEVGSRGCWACLVLLVWLRGAVWCCAPDVGALVRCVIRGQTASNGAGLHGRQATSTAQ